MASQYPPQCTTTTGPLLGSFVLDVGCCCCCCCCWILLLDFVVADIGFIGAAVGVVIGIGWDCECGNSPGIL